jgi:hypothetical protein
MQNRIWIVYTLGLVAIIVFGVNITNSQVPGGATSMHWSQANPTATGNDRILLNQSQTHTGASQIVLVDSAKQVMAVYWIAPENGVIQLKSVRNLVADFQMEEFNGSDPAPSKIRNILGQPK